MKGKIMPQVSETLDSLSKSLAELSDRAKAAEKRAADARSETREQLDAHVADLKASGQRKRDEVHSRNAKAKDEITSRWSELRDQTHSHFTQMQSDIDERRDEHDAKVAQRRADRAAENAAEAIDFAIYAIDEAEVSVLDATDAQVIADSLT
jgi:hypothetical protein